MKLNKNDYLDILNYYKIHIDKNIKTNVLKKKVEEIIANKLCSCIKKVNNRILYEDYSIAICNNSVIKKKNLKIYGFNCKKRKTLKKKNNVGLLKTNKTLTIKGKQTRKKLIY
jgi:hypothetical protein